MVGGGRIISSISCLNSQLFGHTRAGKMEHCPSVLQSCLPLKKYVHNIHSLSLTYNTVPHWVADPGAETETMRKILPNETEEGRDMQEESAGEQARGKSWQSRRGENNSRNTRLPPARLQTSANVMEGNARCPAHFPSWGQSRGDAEKTLLSSENTDGMGGRMEGWAPGGGPGRLKEPCSLQRSSIQAGRTCAVLSSSPQ